MPRLQVLRMLSTVTRSQRGVTFIETVVALAILSAIVVSLLSGLATTSKATIITNEQSTAESLARSQLEWVKNTEYIYEATEYTPATLPSGEDYDNYSAVITAEPLNSPDNGIQKIIVTVKHGDKEVIKMEGYKVDR